MKLSEELKAFRIDMPDEWRMDEFIRKARGLEQKLGLTEIALDHKTTLLDSCERALAKRDGLG
jgi:hypothetical protein